MLSLGMDIGTSTVKLVLLKNQEIEKQWMAVHHGNPFVCLKKGLSTLELAMDTPFSLCVTGSNTEALLEQAPDIPSFGDIPAIVEGVRWIIPQVGSVIEIGSQGARFITDLQSRAPQFAVNEHCAGGTGSFFEDQMSRVGCKLEDYSSLVEQAQSVPRLSGRCAVFAKTDIIHRQQEGATTPDILLGLCYAMIRNYKATIVRRLPICKPVVFCGGVTCNAGVIRAIRDVFGLSEKELIVPEFARYEAALGAARKASGSFTLRQLNDSLDRTLTTHHMVGTLPKLELRSGTSLAEPNATKIIPESGCALGIDIGSTSTDLVLVGSDGELVDFQYLRTAGDPEGAVRKGFARMATPSPVWMRKDRKCLHTPTRNWMWTMKTASSSTRARMRIPGSLPTLPLRPIRWKRRIIWNSAMQRISTTCRAGMKEIMLIGMLPPSQRTMIRQLWKMSLNFSSRKICLRQNKRHMRTRSCQAVRMAILR